MGNARLCRILHATNFRRTELFYTLRSRNETDSKRYGFYLQDTYRFPLHCGLFTLTAGIRGSYWDWNKEFISARVPPWL